MVFLGLAVLVGFTGMCYFYALSQHYMHRYYQTLRERESWRELAWKATDALHDERAKGNRDAIK